MENNSKRGDNMRTMGLSKYQTNFAFLIDGKEVDERTFRKTAQHHDVIGHFRYALETPDVDSTIFICLDKDKCWTQSGNPNLL